MVRDAKKYFSRLTRPTPCRRVRVARFTLEDHAYGALHLPKMTVLQSRSGLPHCNFYFVSLLLYNIISGITVFNWSPVLKL